MISETAGLYSRVRFLDFKKLIFLYREVPSYCRAETNVATPDTTFISAEFLLKLQLG